MRTYNIYKTVTNSETNLEYLGSQEGTNPDEAVQNWYARTEIWDTGEVWAIAANNIHGPWRPRVRTELVREVAVSA